jgi:hypothetical protein
MGNPRWVAPAISLIRLVINENASNLLILSFVLTFFGSWYIEDRLLPKQGNLRAVFLFG